ncbi:MAG: GyrI-like domain-containing protein [Methanothrix sp.]
MSRYDIQIKKVPGLRVASLWGKGLPFSVTVPKAYEELAAWMARKSIPPPSGSPMGLALYYDDPASVSPEEVRFKVAMPVAAKTPGVAEGGAAVEVLPEAEVAYLTVTGSYTNLEEAYSQLFGWVFQNGYQPKDAAREIYLKWGETMSPEEWVTEIQVPVGR